MAEPATQATQATAALSDELLALLRSPAELELELLRRTIGAARERGPEFAEAIRYAAISRRFNLEVVAALRDQPDDEAGNRDILEFLREFPYARQRPDGDHTLQQGTRTLIIDDWLAEEGKLYAEGPTGEEKRALFAEYNRRLSAFYQKKHESLRGYVKDLALAEPVLRQANPERYSAIARRVDVLQTEPLLEALYHEVLRSPDEGYRFFTDQFFEYEWVGRSTVCEALLLATRNALGQHPLAQSRGRWDLWLEYWEGRLANLQRRHGDAERLLAGLRPRTGEDTKLALWTLSELGNALAQLDRLVEAREILRELVALAEESGVDSYNLPVNYSQLAGNSETLGELKEAAEAYRRALRSAQEVGNTGLELSARLSLSRVLAEWGRSAESLVTVVEALDQLRAGAPPTPGIIRELLQNLLPRLRRDPALLDTLYAEGESVLAASQDTQLRLEFGLDYLDSLRESGQLTRAAALVTSLKEQASGNATALFLSTLLLKEGILREEAGNPVEARAAYAVALQLATTGAGVGWNGAAALTNRGLLLRELGRWEEALDDLRTAREHWERIGHRRYAAISMVFEAGVYERRHRVAALRAVEDATGGGALEAYRRRGDRLRLEGEPALAEREYEQLLTAAGEGAAAERGRAWLRRSLLAGQRGDWVAAAAHARAAREAWAEPGLEGPAPPAVPGTGSADLEQAQRLLDAAAVDLDEQLPERLGNLLHFQANLLQDRGRLEEAREHLARVYELYGALPRPRNTAIVLADLADAETELGAWGRALGYAGELEVLWQAFAHAEAYRPSPEAAAADRDNAAGMRAFQETGRERPEKLRRARALFDDAAQHHPEAFWYRLNQAYAAHHLEQWREAAARLEEALRLAPAWFPGALLHRRLIEWHLRCGHECVVEGGSGESLWHYQRARALLEETRLPPGAEGTLSPELWIGVGDGLLKLGELRDAQRWYEQYLHRVGAEEASLLAARVYARVGLIASLRGRLPRALAPLGHAFAWAAGTHEGADELIADLSRLAVGEKTYRALAEPLRLLAASRDLRPETRHGLRQAQLSLSRGRYLSAILGWGEANLASRSWSALMVTPVVIEAAPALFPPGEEWAESHPLFLDYIPAVRERVAAEMGVPLPGIRVRAEESLEATAFRILLHEGLFAGGRVFAEGYFCPVPEALPHAAREGDTRLVPGVNPRTLREDGLWILGSGIAAARTSGVPLWDHFEYLIRFLEAQLRFRLDDFFGIEELELRLAAWLAATEGAAAEARRALLAEALPDLEARVRWVRVLRALLREAVPITDLQALLESFRETGAADTTVAAEAARLAVRERIPAAAPGRRFFRLAPAFEAELAASILTRDGKRYLSLDPVWGQEFLGAVREALAGLDTGEVSVVVAREEIRPFLHTFLAEINEFPRLGVVAARELGPEIDLSAAARIGEDATAGELP